MRSPLVAAVRTRQRQVLMSGSLWTPHRLPDAVPSAIACVCASELLFRRLMERPVTQNSLLSRTIHNSGGLRRDGLYFVDSRLVLDRPHESSKFLDGGVRLPSDFALRVDARPDLKMVSSRSIPRPNTTADLKADYGIENSGLSFQMYENGSARWYAMHIQVNVVHGDSRINVEPQRLVRVESPNG